MIKFPKFFNCRIFFRGYMMLILVNLGINIEYTNTPNIIYSIYQFREVSLHCRFFDAFERHCEITLGTLTNQGHLHAECHQ
jgi:hypothetical protein